MGTLATLVFPALNLPWLEHVFTLREEVLDKEATCLQTLKKAGFQGESLVLAEQPHGNKITQVNEGHAGKVIPEVDGLITDCPNLTLAIRTADCGPLFLVDPEHRAVGVVHSGKKGSQAEILSVAIRSMQEAFQTNPAALIVVLAPCIRPPQYELDFAKLIQDQAKRAGVKHYYDCGLNTGADLRQFYSYRMEQGQTGRHYAALRIRDGASR